MTARRRAILPFTLALGALLVSVACDLREGEGDGSARVEPLCRSAADCAAGDTCVPDLGACVSPEPNDLRVAVQLTPPPTAAYATTQYLGFTLDEANALDLSLPAPRRVRGSVGTLMEPNVLATLTARAPGDIPGTEYRFTTTSRKDQEDAWGYELLLAPTDEYYQVTVTLDNDAFPPFNFFAKFAKENEVLDIDVPRLDDYYTIRGLLVTDEATDTALDSVRVAAFSKRSANVSTVAAVGEDGSFELRVQPEPEGDTYRIVVEPTKRTAAIPTVPLVEEQLVTGDVDLGRLALGDLPAPVAQPMAVEGPDGEPLAGTTVRCRGPVLGGTLTDEATTDSAGSVVLYLRKGSYECTCRPPAGSSAAAARWTDRVVAAGDPWSFALDEKLRVEGTVTEHSGARALRGLTVVAVHTDPDDPLHGREVDTTTDQHGRYALMVEPGVYALVVLPPDGAGLPVAIREGIQIATSAVHDIVLPAATLVTGAVRGAKGEGLAGVRVDFYQVPEPDGAAGGGAEAGAAPDEDAAASAARAPAAAASLDARPDTTYDRLVRVVGSAVTDEEGVYRALLPNP